MKLFTIGYGGRPPAELLELLQSRGVATLVDVRLRPDRSSMGAYSKAKTPEKGIEALLARAGIGYISLVELGNPFLDQQDWKVRYQRLLQAAGDLLTERLADVPAPFCLMCAEKHVEDCHRRLIASYLESRGYEVEHLL